MQSAPTNTESYTGAETSASSRARLMRLVWPAALAVQAISVAATLRLADFVGTEPTSVADLASGTRCHEPSLRRLLRALSSIGVFVEDPPDHYRGTELSDLLRSNHPQSMQPWALLMASELVRRPCGELASAVSTGKTPFPDVFGLTFFDYLATHPEAAAIFDNGIQSLPRRLTPVADVYDFSQFFHIVDVGGRHGDLLVRILTGNRAAHGVVYDLPGVVADIRLPSDREVARRIEVVGGNFLEGVPTGGDAYILSYVLHDWPDAMAARILRNCRQAMQRDGSVLIVEGARARTTSAGAFMDLLMMVLTGGRERSAADFRALLGDAGLALTRVIQTPAGMLVEARRPD